MNFTKWLLVGALSINAMNVYGIQEEKQSERKIYFDLYVAEDHIIDLIKDYKQGLR